MDMYKLYNSQFYRIHLTHLLKSQLRQKYMYLLKDSNLLDQKGICDSLSIHIYYLSD